MKSIALARLKNGETVTDETFDEIYPDEIRRHCARHFTPVSVAKRAAQLLDRGPATRILDIGSGGGKFCFTGALTTRASYCGVEHREGLVSLCRYLADANAIARVDFVHGDFKGLDWNAFDGFYLFNPFIENLYRAHDRIDESRPQTKEAYLDDIRFVKKRLAAARPGTRVATFHGWGGEFPLSYRVTAREPHAGNELVVWEKVSVTFQA